MQNTKFVKDPSASLDYTIDWSEWLEDGDTIDSCNVTVLDETLAVADISNDDTTVTFWVDLGTVGQNYDLTVAITTAGGRIDERTVHILVRER